MVPNILLPGNQRVYNPPGMNWCWLGVTIQVLLRIPEVQKLLQTLTFEFVPSFGLEAVLYQLMLIAQTYAENPSAVIHLKDFMSALHKTGEYSQLFQKDGHAVMRTGRRSFVQQCALEGHLCLVKIVTDAFQALWETERLSEFGKIFGSKLQIIYSCAEDTCHSSYSVKHGLPETQILLPLLPSTQSLSDALVAYMGQKADRKCKMCGAIKGTDQKAFELMPPYLVLAVGRVDYKVVGYTPEGAKVVDLVKDIRPITYSAMLDMSPFANLALRESGESMLYGLCAVQLHDGRTPSSGHWTSLQQVGQDSWVIRNDMEAPRAVSTAQALSFQRECSMFLYSRLSRTAPPAPLSVPQSPSLHASCSSAAPSSSQPRGINSNMQSVVAASARLAASSEPLWRQQLDSMWKQPMHLSTDQLFANARSRERFLQPSQSLHSHASPGTAHETALTLRQPAQRSASALKPSVLRSFEPRMVGAAGVNTSSAYNTSSATGAAIASSTAVDAQPAGHSGSSSTSASVGSRGSTHGLDCGQADVKTGVKSTARPSHVIAINAGAGVPPPRQGITATQPAQATAKPKKVCTVAEEASEGTFDAGSAPAPEEQRHETKRPRRRGFLGRMVHGVCSFAREHPEAVVAVVSGVVGGVILGRAGSGRRRA